MANNAFSAVTNNRFTRRWAGNSAGSVDPFITGYFFVKFAYLPKDLISVIQAKGDKSSLGSDTEIKNVLESSCLGVTIPGGTVNKAEFTGLGGVKWSVPTNVEFDNTITLKFLEYSSMPIYSIMSSWVKMIRDYRTGASKQLTGDNYTKSNYAASMYYWTTKPDGKTVEYATCATGMFPTKDPADSYSSDITAFDKVEVDIDFSVDYLWNESWVYNNCQTYADTFHGESAKVDEYPSADAP